MLDGMLLQDLNPAMGKVWSRQTIEGLGFERFVDCQTLALHNTRDSWSGIADVLICRLLLALAKGIRGISILPSMLSDGAQT